MVNCYELLRVKPDADEATIRKAYRSRSRELHPDVNPSSTAASEFAALTSAVNTLLDPIARLKHDDYFSLNKHVRNQDANAKQKFSEYQQQKASTLVNEWSNDYGKAMDMRQRQRLDHVTKHKKRMQRVVIVAVISVTISVLLAILFLTSIIALP